MSRIYNFNEQINMFEQELKEIESIVNNGDVNENIGKIETFMTDFMLYIKVNIYDAENSPPYKRLSKLYIEDKMFILNMKQIVPICWGFIRNLKR